MIGRRHLCASGLFLLTAIGSGCGGGAAGPAGEAVRPKEPTAAQAMGESSEGGEAGVDCSRVSEDARPFLADWKTDDRATLEAAMQDSVAVVKYTCKGIKVLSDCKLPGSTYGFAQVAIKKDDLIIDQSSDLAATIPLSAVSISGEIQRGLKLKLRYALIGRKATQPDQILRTDLKGGNKCEGATHFVRAAWVGAFEFGTATEGKAGASAKVLGAGAEHHSKSAKEMARAEGELEKCKADAAASGQPPTGCNGLVRLQLGPIVEKIKQGQGDEPPPDVATGSQKAVDAKNPCSIGYVLGADGECKKKSGATAYLCDPKNKDECVTQCEKGSPESCHNAASAVIRAAKPEGGAEAEKAAIGYYEKGCTGNYAPSCTAFANRNAMGMSRDVTKAREFYEKGCKLGDPNSCSSLAYAAESPFLSADSKAFQASPTTAFKYMETACNLGGGFACADVARRYIEGKGVLANADSGVKALEKGCKAGAISACTTLADHLATGKGGVKQDPKRALTIYHQNCEQKNMGSACFGAAQLYRDGAAEGKKNPENAKKHLEHACNNLKYGMACVALGQMYESGEVGNKDIMAAAKVYEVGCPANKTYPNEGCQGLADLLDKGSKEVPKNPEKAAIAYSRACSVSTYARPALDKTNLAPAKACRKAVELFKKQKNEKEALGPLGRLCYSHGDKKACDERRKIAPSGGPVPPPPPSGTGLGKSATPPATKPPPGPPPPKAPGPPPKSATK